MHTLDHSCILSKILSCVDIVIDIVMDIVIDIVIDCVIWLQKLSKLKECVALKKGMRINVEASEYEQWQHLRVVPFL